MAQQAYDPFFRALTLEDAVDHLYGRFTKSAKEFVLKNDPAILHHSMGIALRNDWKLWVIDTPLVQHIQHRFKLSHGDDCSGLIFAGLWAKAKAKGEDVEAALKKAAAKYVAHWNKNK